MVALESQARKATVPVTIEAESVGRYTQDVEATVYFCVLEALQNVQKYADASGVVVRPHGDEDALMFDVHDDGKASTRRTAKQEPAWPICATARTRLRGLSR